MIPAVNYGACQAPFSSAGENPDTAIGFRILVHDFRGSITTAIIDNDDLIANAEWLYSMLNPAKKSLNISSLIQGWYDQREFIV